VAVLPEMELNEVVAQGWKFAPGSGDGEVSVELQWGVAGGRAIDEAGTPLPDHTLQLCRESDAILFGSVGGPTWDNLAPEIRPERGLLRLRQELGLFANLRPAKVFTALVVPLPKREWPKGLDIVTVRSSRATSPRRTRGVTALRGQRRLPPAVYTTAEIDRIARLAQRSLGTRPPRHLGRIKPMSETSRLWRWSSRWPRISQTCL
jgi:3-isopropylmalate dehydrogenase